MNNTNTINAAKTHETISTKPALAAYRVEVNMSGVIGWISYARFCGNICERWHYSVEDFEAAKFSRSRALVVAKACGGKLVRA